MSDAAVKILKSAEDMVMTRRAFVEASVTMAGGAALAVTPLFSGNKVFAAPAAPKAGADDPVLTLDLDFTGWPVYDFSGNELSFVPSAGRQPGAAMAALSDEEFYRDHMYL